MSIRARAVNKILHTFKGKLFNEDLDVVDLREKVSSAAKRAPAPPPGFHFETTTIENLPCLWVKNQNATTDKAILYLHGGGYIFCSAQTTHKDILWRLSAAAKCNIIAVDYRLAPEHPYPAALEDSISIYRWLLNNGYKGSDLAIAGDSAGGGLTYSSVLKIRDLGLELPAATLGMSPWTDLAVTGDTVVTNLDRDPLIPGDGLSEGAEYYLGGADPKDPYASPLYGDQSGLPPTLIQVSTNEVLLDDSKRLASKYREAGVSVDLELWEGLPHVWQSMAMIIPEGKAALMKSGMFLRKHLATAEPPRAPM